MKKKEIKNILSSLDHMELPDKNKIINSCPATETGDIKATDSYIITNRKRRFSRPLIALCSLLFFTVIAKIVLFVLPSNPTTNSDTISAEVSETDNSNLSEEVPAKELTLTYCLEKGEDYAAKRLRDYTCTQLQEAWGAPDTSLSGFWGDIWKVDNSYSIGIYYDSNGFVEHIILHRLSANNADAGLIDDSDSPITSGNYSSKSKRPEIAGIFYSFENFYKKTAEGYMEDNSYECHLAKRLDNNEPLWEIVLDFAEIHGSHICGDLILFYGIDTKGNTTIPLIVLVNSEGELLWRKEFFNGFKGEYITHAKINSDEIDVLLRSDSSTVVLTTFDLSSNKIGVYEYDLGIRVKDIYKIPEGHLFLLTSMDYSDDYFVLIDNSHSVKGDIYIPYEDTKYFFTDVISYNGYLYLSTNGVPVLTSGENTAGGRYEIASMLNKISYEYKYQISDDETTQLAREHFTANLIKYDLSTGETEVVYTAPQCIAHTFEHSDTPDDTLVWEVGDITYAHFSAGTSAYSVMIEAAIKNMIFDSSTELVSTEETGRTFNYLK